MAAEKYMNLAAAFLVAVFSFWSVSALADEDDKAMINITNRTGEPIVVAKAESTLPGPLQPAAEVTIQPDATTPVYVLGINRGTGIIETFYVQIKSAKDSGWDIARALVGVDLRLWGSGSSWDAFIYQHNYPNSYNPQPNGAIQYKDGTKAIVGYNFVVKKSGSQFSVHQLKG